MNIKKIFIFTLLIWILISCSDNIDTTNQIVKNTQVNVKQNIEKSNLKSVWVLEFKKEIEKNDWILIDLRTPEEVEKWVIPWTKLNLDYYSFNFKEELKFLDKSKKYLIYCKKWKKSWETLLLMKKLWFRDIINLKWWIISWWNDLANFKDINKNQ